MCEGRGKGERRKIGGDGKGGNLVQRRHADKNWRKDVDNNPKAFHVLQSFGGMQKPILGGKSDDRRGDLPSLFEHADQRRGKKGKKVERYGLDAGGCFRDMGMEDGQKNGRRQESSDEGVRRALELFYFKKLTTAKGGKTANNGRGEKWIMSGHGAGVKGTRQRGR